jgi:hypothetical protein
MTKGCPPQHTPGVEVIMYNVAACSTISFRNMDRRLSPTAYTWSRGHPVHFGCMKGPSPSGTWIEGCPPRYTPGVEIIVYNMAACSDISFRNMYAGCLPQHTPRVGVIVYTLAAMKCPLLQEHGPKAVPHGVHLE